ncbi:hypothetical protein CGA22_07800 [Pseudomonas sp. PSB18]|nr:hypothetical protein [Pseudomonas sp. PSB18]
MPDKKTRHLAGFFLPGINARPRFRADDLTSESQQKFLRGLKLRASATDTMTVEQSLWKNRISAMFQAKSLVFDCPFD